MRDPIKRSLAALVVLLPISLVLLVHFRDTIREIIIVPVLYLLWLLELTFNSIDQTVWWGLLLALSAVLLFSAVRPQRRTKSPRQWTDDPSRWGNRRIAHWAKQVECTRNGMLWGFRSASDLRDLILQVLAYRRRISPPELEQEIAVGSGKWPPEILAYLESERCPHAARRRSRNRTVNWLRTVLDMNGTKAQTASDDAILVAAVRTLEAEFVEDGEDPQ